VIDQRVGNLMRTPEVTADISSIGTGEAAKKTGENGTKTHGNAADWRGGAERPERVSWGVWFKDAAGFDVEEVKCKGWEHGTVGSEDE